MLLETLCAIVLLSIAGISIVTLATEQIASVNVAQRIARAEADRTRLLTTLTLLTNAELRTFASPRSIGRYTVQAVQIAPDLFVARVADPTSGAPVLSTIVFADQR